MQLEILIHQERLHAIWFQLFLDVRIKIVFLFKLSIIFPTIVVSTRTSIINGKAFELTLISRRSVFRAGTR